MSRRVQLRDKASESRIESLAFVPEILNGGRRVCPRTAPGGEYPYAATSGGGNFTRSEFTMTLTGTSSMPKARSC